jgi:hypothetical protein
LPVARSLHEADLLLETLADPEEGGLVRQWLEDRDDAWVRPRQTRAAVERIEGRLEERMRESAPSRFPGRARWGASCITGCPLWRTTGGKAWHLRSRLPCGR